MNKTRVGVLTLAALSALEARAQLPPRPRPSPTLPSGAHEPRSGRPQPTPPRVDPCQDFNSQPLLTLTLPDRIYREDAITATWEVRDRRPGVQWAHPVQIETSLATPAFPASPSRRGTHAYTTPAQSGNVTLRTRCGEKRVSWERIPDAFLEAVSPGRGASGSEVTLTGSQFGNERLGGRVEIEAGGATHAMTVTSWENVRVRATVPNVASGAAQVRLVKGGRRPTLWRPFRIVKSITVDNAVASLALASLGIAPGFIHLDAGSNASSITLPASLSASLGLPATFTLVSVDLNVPQGEKIAQTALLPLTGFPEKARYEAHDVNSNGLAASVAGGQLVLTLTFESGGAEIKGRVRYCNVGAFGACADSSWRDDLAPDVQIDNVRVTLRLTPGAANGALTFPAGQGTVEADVQIGNDFANWIIPGLRTYTNDLKADVLARVSARLNAPATRNAIASALMGRFRALDPSFQSVVAVTPNGNSILVEYE